MKHCTNCGSELQDHVKFCGNCGAPVVQQNNEPQTQTNDIVQQPINTVRVKTPRKKQSALGIVAFILSFTFFLSPIAVILAIIALATNKGAKKGLAIAGLIIGTIMSLFLISFFRSVSSSSGSTTHSSSIDNSQNYTVADKTDKEPVSVTTPAQNTKESFIETCETVAYHDVERSPASYKGKNVRIEGRVIQVSEGWLDSVIYRVATDSHANGDIWYVTYTRSSDEERILENDYVVIYGICDGVESYKSVLGSSVTIPAMKAKYIDVNAAKEPEYTTKLVNFEISQKSYSNDYQYFAVVEIRNTGDNSIYISDVSFDIEDSSGHLLQTDDFGISVYRSIIKPNEVGYLYTSYEQTLKNAETDLVLKPSFKAQTTFVELAHYEISDTSLAQGTFGVCATGRVTNQTNKDDSYVYLRVIFYDAEGKVLGIDGTSITDLTAGSTKSFEVKGLSSSFSVKDVASYEILAEETYYGF